MGRRYDGDLRMLSPAADQRKQCRQWCVGKERRHEQGDLRMLSPAADQRKQCRQ
jgi:hypothetical protein